MRKLTLMAAGTFLFSWLTGCTTFNMTNLTPSSQIRNDEGLYMVEVEIRSNQQSLRWDSIKPFVVMGFDFYEMERTPLMQNRWETVIPIPADQEFVHYRFKVDFDYNDFGSRGHGSKMSTEYTLSVREETPK